VYHQYQIDFTFFIVIAILANTSLNHGSSFKSDSGL